MKKKQRKITLIDYLLLISVSLFFIPFDAMAKTDGYNSIYESNKNFKISIYENHKKYLSKDFFEFSMPFMVKCMSKFNIYTPIDYTSICAKSFIDSAPTEKESIRRNHEFAQSNLNAYLITH